MGGIVAARNDRYFEEENSIGLQQANRVLDGLAKVEDMFEDGDGRDDIKGSLVTVDQACIGEVGADYEEALGTADISHMSIDFDSETFV